MQGFTRRPRLLEGRFSHPSSVCLTPAGQQSSLPKATVELRLPATKTIPGIDRHWLSDESRGPPRGRSLARCDATPPREHDSTHVLPASHFDHVTSVILHISRDARAFDRPRRRTYRPAIDDRSSQCCVWEAYIVESCPATKVRAGETSLSRV